VAAGGDVVLEAVPGTHDVHGVLVEHGAEAALRGVEALAHPRHDPSLARRAALVGAHVLVGVEPPAEAEHADGHGAGAGVDGDDEPPALGHVVARADVEGACRGGGHGDHRATRPGRCKALR
jgi:hypothetical protein